MQNEKCRVLIAEDQDHLRLLVRNIVKGLGLVLVGEACDGQEAVDKYQELKPDLTLLDINMPHKTGVEALKEILDLDEYANVVMLTSVFDMATVQQCVDAGALHYVLKTSPVAEIKAALTEVIEDL